MNVLSQYVPVPPNAAEEGVLPQSPDEAWAGALLSAQICMNVTPAIIHADADAQVLDPVPLDGN